MKLFNGFIRRINKIFGSQQKQATILPIAEQPVSMPAKVIPIQMQRYMSPIPRVALNQRQRRKLAHQSNCYS